MPKKFVGENTKAQQARARKQAVRQEEDEIKQKAADDAYWKDDNKQLQKKNQRKDEKEKKKIDQLERKKENDQLLEEEMSSIKSAKPMPSGKVTRAEITAHQEKLAQEAAKGKKAPLLDELPLEENINRLVVDGEEARDVDEAIATLSGAEAKVDRHPEKRMKAAYQDFEDLNLPRLKAENPNLRLSQLKQMLKKDWMKSPDNPLNRRH